MRKAYHIDQRVQCADCPVFYCIECQPTGCICGSKEYLYDHNGHEYNEKGHVETENLPSREGQILYSSSSTFSLPPSWGSLGAAVQPGQVLTYSSGGYQSLVGSTGAGAVTDEMEPYRFNQDTTQGATLTESNLRTAVNTLRDHNSSVGSIDREALNRAYNTIFDHNLERSYPPPVTAPGALMRDTSSLNSAGRLAQEIDASDELTHEQLQRERRSAFENLLREIIEGRRIDGATIREGSMLTIDPGQPNEEHIVVRSIGNGLVNPF